MLDLSGVALRVDVPPQVAERAPAPGARLSLLTHLVVAQDAAPKLFGFATPDARALFRLLLSVAGIGPGMALRVLSARATPAEVAQAIARGDEAALRVKGVGPKLAKRVVTELKDKIGGLGGPGGALGAGALGVGPGGALAPAASGPAGAGAADPVLEDAFLALRGLEVEPEDARRLLREARAALPQATSPGELVRLVLQRF